MTDHPPMPEGDDDAPKPAELKHAWELHDAYHQYFGEWASAFGVVYESKGSELDTIEQALKPGQPIEDQGYLSENASSIFPGGSE